MILSLSSVVAVSSRPGQFSLNVRTSFAAGSILWILSVAKLLEVPFSILSFYRIVKAEIIRVRFVDGKLQGSEPGPDTENGW